MGSPGLRQRGRSAPAAGHRHSPAVCGRSGRRLRAHRPGAWSPPTRAGTSTRILCCPESSDCRRTCRMGGLDARATKDQLISVRGLPRRAEASRRPPPAKRTPHAKAPRKRVSPGQNNSAWGRPVGRVGLEPKKGDASHLQRCRNNGQYPPLSMRLRPPRSRSNGHRLGVRHTAPSPARSSNALEEHREAFTFQYSRPPPRGGSEQQRREPQGYLQLPYQSMNFTTSLTW